MKPRPVPTVEPKRMEELVTLLKSEFKAERLLNLWNCSPNQATFIERAKEAGYNDAVINLFLRP